MKLFRPRVETRNRKTENRPPFQRLEELQKQVSLLEETLKNKHQRSALILYND